MESASRLLRRLVNEDYNTIINAQLLSSIYVRTKKISEYKLLKSRVPEEYLYEMPAEEEYRQSLDLKENGREKTFENLYSALFHFPYRRLTFPV